MFLKKVQNYNSADIDFMPVGLEIVAKHSRSFKYNSSPWFHDNLSKVSADSFDVLF